VRPLLLAVLRLLAAAAPAAAAPYAFYAAFPGKPFAFGE
jgi:hypothetical protein